MAEYRPPLFGFCGSKMFQRIWENIYHSIYSLFAIILLVTTLEVNMACYSPFFFFLDGKRNVKS